MNIRVNSSTIRWFCGGLCVLVLSACAGCPGGEIDLGEGPPVITGLGPCRAMPGDFVDIHGARLNGAGGETVRFNGIEATVVTETPYGLRAKVPPGATSGKVTVSNRNGTSTSTKDFEVGIDLPVPEVEPNDDINGGNATMVEPFTTGTGTLATPSDKDHFSWDCIVQSATYRIKLTPRVVGVVFVNGTATALDANGEAFVRGGLNGAPMIFGLTGGTGAYSLSLTYDHATWP